MASADCLLQPGGTQGWWQTFSSDAFGNLSKTGKAGGATSFLPTYTSNPFTNQVSGEGYDANGNLTSDGVNTYAWDADGNPAKLNSLGLTFDALDRMVELKSGSSYTQLLYGTLGNKLALMSGQALARAFVPLSGGDTAVYKSSGLAYYRHGDWQGSSRLASTTSRTVYYDGAYAPYGENYAETGTTDRNYTGQNQDILSTGSYPLYDFLHREYHPAWGRWVSPDPAGMNAVAAGNPQTWNRYAYVANNPTTFIDSLGLIQYAYPWNSYGDLDYLESYIAVDGGGGDSGYWVTIFNPDAGNLPDTNVGGGGGAGLAILPLGNLTAVLRSLAPVTSCSAEDLNSPSFFSDSDFATPDQVAAFMQAQVNAPRSWNGLQAAYAFSGAGLNPGIAVGVIGAETSFGNSGLSQYNISNPFSALGATNFTSSMAGALGTVMKLESTTYTPGTPLDALTNGQNVLGQVYTSTQQQAWRSNVNSWFRKLAKFIGNCI